ncbi:MAG: hypothetical protein EOM19_07440 [Candidatus Moranbacteria bacterium]|nr:hypothetical protein [Candidatus Moranbacteria bacterium]
MDKEKFPSFGGDTVPLEKTQGEQENRMGVVSLEETRVYILNRIRQLGEIQEEEDGNNNERALTTRALSFISEARQWFETFPQRSWEDFAWEKRNAQWDAYKKSREERRYNEDACLDAFREADVVLEYIKKTMLFLENKE